MGARGFFSPKTTLDPKPGRAPLRSAFAPQGQTASPPPAAAPPCRRQGSVAPPTPLLTSAPFRAIIKPSSPTKARRPMKLGIIRCMQTEDYCPGTTDFRLLAAHEGAFQNISEPIELIGFTIAAAAPASAPPCARACSSSAARTPSPSPPASARARPSATPAPSSARCWNWSNRNSPKAQRCLNTPTDAHL